MHTPPLAAMLFAAGFGTRMGTLTANFPKPLIKVSGKALIDYTLDLCSDAGISKVVANSHYQANVLENHLSSHNIVISHEKTILETGGGLRHALPLLGSNPVFTSNTDAVWTGENPFTALKKAWDPQYMDALLMLIPSKSAYGHGGTGDFSCDTNGRISRKGDLIYSGVQIIKTDGLHEIQQPVFSLNMMWDMMVSNHKAFAIIHSGEWCDVGSPKGIAAAENMLSNQHDR